jgi:hypothetical protein
MASYEVVLKDGAVETILGADTYEQEGPLTTFFELAADRHVVDCWSVRLASIRTSEIVRVRRLRDGVVLAALSERRAG